MASKRKSTDAGEAEVQDKFDEANAKGYFGTVPDPTPNSAYSVAGVTSGAPTPETDADAFAAAEAEARDLSTAEPTGEPGDK